ncbi:MAG TPA: FliA/WhiG family RNA polymerase sigma factor [Thermoanaerobacterales bacterium]|nr:FliA/WhiG family RNA polymerase sigma factor [Thermoanaerobacterales bacterium]
MCGVSKDKWHKYKITGDPNIKHEIIKTYAPLVKKVAGRVLINIHFNIEFDDLLGYGTFGLLDAIDKFNLNYGVKFETYAYTRIKGAIIDGIRKNSWVPRSTIEKIKSVEGAIEKLQEKLGRSPTDTEIKKYLGLSTEEYNKIITEITGTNITSFEDMITKNIKLTNNDLNSNPEYMVMRSELKKVLGKAVENLNKNERMVITLYYYEGMSLKEIATILSISTSRVSQIHTKAILRLRGGLSRKKHLLY